MKPLYLIDASIYVFRAWYSLPDDLVDPDGHPVNAVYGFARFLASLLQQRRPQHLCVAFDESLAGSFRNEIYPGYKANREPAPEELKQQFRWCRELVELLGIRHYASERYEADDLIGTVAHKMRPRGFRMVYVTGDKDLGQLVHGHDRLWDFAAEREYGPGGLRERHGVHPRQLVDLLALAGDAVDNIPGVPGVGLKTATALLNRFDSLERMYDWLERNRLDDDPVDVRGKARIDRLLREHQSQAEVSQQLATIARDAPIRCSVAGLRRKPVRSRNLDHWLDERGMGQRLRAQLLSC